LEKHGLAPTENVLLRHFTWWFMDFSKIYGYLKLYCRNTDKNCALERIALKFKIKNSSIYDPAGLHLQTLIDIHAVVYILFI